MSWRSETVARVLQSDSRTDEQKIEAEYRILRHIREQQRQLTKRRLESHARVRKLQKRIEN